MFDLGLPVPRPVAARIVRKGIFYRAEVTEEIENATTFGKNLAANNLSTSMLKELVLRCDPYMVRASCIRTSILRIFSLETLRRFFSRLRSDLAFETKEIQFGIDIEA